MTVPRRLRVVPSPQAGPAEPPEASPTLADLVQRLGALQRELAAVAAELERRDGRLAAPEAEAPRWRPAKWLAFDCGVTPRTIIRWAQAASAARRLAGRWLIDSDALARWLAGRGGSRRR